MSLFFSDVFFDAICLVSICFFVTFVVHTMWNTKIYDGSVVRLFWEFAACNSPVSLLDSCNVFKPLDYRMPPRSATCWEPKKKGPCYMVARHNLTAGVWVEILKFSMEFNGQASKVWPWYTPTQRPVETNRSDKRFFFMEFHQTRFDFVRW